MADFVFNIREKRTGNALKEVTEEAKKLVEQTDKVEKSAGRATTAVEKLNKASTSPTPTAATATTPTGPDPIAAVEAEIKARLQGLSQQADALKAIKADAATGSDPAALLAVAGKATAVATAIVASISAINSVLKVFATEQAAFQQAEENLARFGRNTDEQRTRVNDLANSMERLTGVANQDLAVALSSLDVNADDLTKYADAFRGLVDLTQGDATAAAAAFNGILADEREVMEALGLVVDRNADRHTRLAQAMAQLEVKAAAAARKSGDLEKAQTGVSNSAQNAAAAVGSFISKISGNEIDRFASNVQNIFDKITNKVAEFIGKVESADSANTDNLSAEFTALTADISAASAEVEAMTSALQNQQQQAIQTAAAVSSIGKVNADLNRSQIEQNVASGTITEIEGLRQKQALEQQIRSEQRQREQQQLTERAAAVTAQRDALEEESAALEKQAAFISEKIALATQLNTRLSELRDQLAAARKLGLYNIQYGIQGQIDALLPTIPAEGVLEKQQAELAERKANFDAASLESSKAEAIVLQQQVAQLKATEPAIRQSEETRRQLAIEAALAKQAQAIFNASADARTAPGFEGSVQKFAADLAKEAEQQELPQSIIQALSNANSSDRALLETVLSALKQGEGPAGGPTQVDAADPVLRQLIDTTRRRANFQNSQGSINALGLQQIIDDINALNDGATQQELKAFQASIVSVLGRQGDNTVNAFAALQSAIEARVEANYRALLSRIHKIETTQNQTRRRP